MTTRLGLFHYQARSDPISCYGSRLILTSPSDGVLCSLRIAHARFLSDTTHCPKMIPKSACRRTVSNSGSGPLCGPVYMNSGLKVKPESKFYAAVTCHIVKIIMRVTGTLVAYGDQHFKYERAVFSLRIPPPPINK